MMKQDSIVQISLLANNKAIQRGSMGSLVKYLGNNSNNEEQKYLVSLEGGSYRLEQDFIFLEQFQDLHLTSPLANDSLNLKRRVEAGGILDLQTLESQDKSAGFRCNFASNGIRYVDMSGSRVLISENLVRGYCVAVYQLAWQNSRLTPTIYQRFAMNQTEPIDCYKANLVFDKSDVDLFRSIMRVVLLCRTGKQHRLLMFRNIGGSAVLPVLNVTLQGGSIKRIETILFKGFLFIAYLNDLNRLYVLKDLTNVDQDKTINADSFIYIDGVVSFDMMMDTSS